MKRLLIAAALLAAAPFASAGITGTVTDCGGPQCVGVARLQLNPTAADTQGPRSLFVGLFQVVNGEPDPTKAGWFNGKSWQTGLPKAAWTGQMRGPQTATVRIPGGVCGLTAAAGGAPGIYGLYAGWGRPTEVTGTLDVAETEAMIRQADPETAALLRKQLQDYQQAVQRASQTIGKNGDNAAFTQMRVNQTYWLVRSFDCTRRGTPDAGTGGDRLDNAHGRRRQH